jgi:hypothetical protein
LYKATQLPFREWKELVGELKNKLGRSGSSFPLVFELKSADGTLLVRQEFRNVWHHKSQPQVVTQKDWEHPLTLEIWRGSPMEVISAHELGKDEATPTHPRPGIDMKFSEVSNEFAEAFGEPKIVEED